MSSSSTDMTRGSPPEGDGSMKVTAGHREEARVSLARARSRRHVRSSRYRNVEAGSGPEALNVNTEEAIGDRTGMSGSDPVLPPSLHSYSSSNDASMITEARASDHESLEVKPLPPPPTSFADVSRTEAVT